MELIFPLALQELGGGPHWVRGEGRKASPDTGPRENLTFLKCGVTTLRIKTGEPHKPCVNLVVLLPTGLDLLGAAQGPCKPMPEDALLWRVGYPVEPSSQLY